LASVPVDLSAIADLKQMAHTPDPREVAPWVASIELLWDDPEFESKHRALAKAEARRWDRERVADRFHAFFEQLRD
jgi:hypothetical protein